MTDLPHDPYMDAVDQALTAAGIGVSDGWTTDGDAYDDQGAAIPSAVFLWDPNHPAVDAAEFPHGIAVFWNPVAGWEAARRAPFGANETPHPLVPDMWAKPEHVVTAVGEFLALVEEESELYGEWEHADAGKAAVAAWRAA